MGFFSFSFLYKSVKDHNEKNLSTYIINQFVSYIFFLSHLQKSSHINND